MLSPTEMRADLPGAAVGGLHDPGPAAGDDREAASPSVRRSRACCVARSPRGCGPSRRSRRRAEPPESLEAPAQLGRIRMQPLRVGELGDVAPGSAVQQLLVRGAGVSRLELVGHPPRVGGIIGYRPTVNHWSGRPIPRTRGWTRTSGAGGCWSSGGLFARVHVRRADDGPDRARGRDLEGAAVPLLPQQVRVLPGRLEPKAEGLAELTETDPTLPPLEAITASLDAYLGWIEANSAAYGRLVLLQRGGDPRGPRHRRPRPRHDRAPDPRRPLPGRGAGARPARRRARVAVVHGRGDPGLGRAARHEPRSAPRSAAGDAARRRDRGR